MSSLQAESRIPIVPLFVSLAFQPAKGLDFPMLDPWTGVPNMCLKLLTSQRGSPLLSSVESPPWAEVMASVPFLPNSMCVFF